MIETLTGTFETTDLDIVIRKSPTTAGNAETDDANAPGPGDVGIAWCDDSVSSIRCDQHYVAFATYFAGRGLACHETGHAVGLTHGKDAFPERSQDPVLGCMIKSTSDPYLRSHNSRAINHQY